MELPETYVEPLRWTMVASLLYGTYLVAWCPCKTPVGCKQRQFYGAVLLPVAATYLFNRSSAA